MENKESRVGFLSWRRLVGGKSTIALLKKTIQVAPPAGLCDHFQAGKAATSLLRVRL